MKSFKDDINEHGYYHYGICGLDYVYLKNGFVIKIFENNEAIAVTDLAYLFQTLTKYLLTPGRLLTGREFRFLRKEMDMPVVDMATNLSIKHTDILNWEAGEFKPTRGNILLIHDEKDGWNVSEKWLT